MQISELPASSTLLTTDVLVKETGAGVTQKIAVSNIIENDLNALAEGKVLDARQGKVLNDAVNTKLNKTAITISGTALAITTT